MTLEKVLQQYNFRFVNSFPHWQYLSLGYLCKRASKYMKIFKYIEKFFDFLRLSDVSIPYNLGQTTFIFKKNE